MDRYIEAMAIPANAGWRFWALVAETLRATASVLARRGPIVGAAMRNPARGDSRELNRMGTEKVIAFTQSGQSLMHDMMQFQRLTGEHVLDFWSLAWRGVPPGREDYERFVIRWLAMAGLAAESGLGALAPVHATVTANAARLG